MDCSRQERVDIPANTSGIINPICQHSMQYFSVTLLSTLFNIPVTPVHNFSNTPVNIPANTPVNIPVYPPANTPVNISVYTPANTQVNAVANAL